MYTFSIRNIPVCQPKKYRIAILKAVLHLIFKKNPKTNKTETQNKPPKLTENGF